MLNPDSFTTSSESVYNHVLAFMEKEQDDYHKSVKGISQTLIRTMIEVLNLNIRSRVTWYEDQTEINI